MAGVQFADDGWQHIRKVVRWYDEEKLDVEIQKSLMSLPFNAIEDKSSVWIEAFRAGASIRFDQYREQSHQQGVNKAIGLIVGVTLPIIIVGGVIMYCIGYYGLGN